MEIEQNISEWLTGPEPKDIKQLEAEIKHLKEMYELEKTENQRKGKLLYDASQELGTANLHILRLEKEIKTLKAGTI